MDAKWTFLGGMGAGAAVMFVLEPSAARRRALLRDKAVSLGRRGGRLSRRASRDLFNRTKGVVAEAFSRVRQQAPSGERLAERVRSQMGRAVSAPSAIDVTVDEGRVTLRGPILAEEVQPLLTRVRGVRGVSDVVNELTVYEEPGRVPALQSHRRLQPMSRWSPTARVLSGIAAGTLAVFAVAKRVA